MKVKERRGMKKNIRLEGKEGKEGDGQRQRKWNEKEGKMDKEER